MDPLILAGIPLLLLTASVFLGVCVGVSPALLSFAVAIIVLFPSFSTWLPGLR